MDVKVIQKKLNEFGYNLTIDGRMGPKTQAAVRDLQGKHGLKQDGIVGKNTFAILFPPQQKYKMMSTEQITRKYGVPGPDNLIIIDLPYPMKIAWDLEYITKRIQCHKLIAEPLKAVFNELLEVYGLEEIQRLGIDLYGGCYSFRKMRGGNNWSRHAWGIAIDLDPARNGLKTKAPEAVFSGPEYAAMIDIFYKHGFVGLGPEEDRDWMHFQIKE